MAVASRKHGDVHQLTVLMAEGTGRSQKLCVATPCMRSIVNGLNKVWLDGATTREPRHLRRRSELFVMRRRQTYLRIPGLQGFEIKGRVINDGYTDKRDRTVASYIEHET